MVQERGRERAIPSNGENERVNHDLPFIEGGSEAQNRRERGRQGMALTQQPRLDPTQNPLLSSNRDGQGTFQGGTKEGQEFPAQEAGSPRLVVSDSDHRNDPTGEYWSPIPAILIDVHPNV